MSLLPAKLGTVDEEHTLNRSVPDQQLESSDQRLEDNTKDPVCQGLPHIIEKAIIIDEIEIGPTVIQASVPSGVESVAESEAELTANNRPGVQNQRNVEQFLCDLCNFKTKRRLNLINHIRIHTRDKPFSCYLCTFNCSHKTSLYRHMHIHTGYKPFSCNLCNYKCSEKTNLTRHIRTHTGDKPFSCHLCNFNAISKYHLNRHIRIHTGDKPFSCYICDFRTSRSCHLLKTHSHTRAHLYWKQTVLL